ncbi:hypothetical protein AVEN_135458-1 [Araneus ventricosus]|uniref:Reverse transcriptase domain-containing protein n=1 Tax=Araneus ventricosus TaxID=182803 RepID=A0A4Y2BCR6_ARAVE|nr:hypothetical protein AVEN_135458-1 [Araneus ventricosus]
MYRQILVDPDQQDLQRIVWKKGPNAEVSSYRLKTITYGMSNAPFLAMRTLQQLAEDEKLRFPLASEVLLHDTYMDDIVSRAPDLETARRLQSQLRDALQSCGMTLHKWSSNSPELLNSSLSTDVEHSFSVDTDLSVKTLGISWKPFQDRFVFKVSISIKPSYTKREVLCVIARLYGTLGFLGPVLTRAKVLLQRLWQQRLDWDDVLPSPIADEWKEFVTTMKCIEKVQRLTENCSWTHVPSHLNPADLVSRGLIPRDLPELKLWWSGPSFLERGELSSGPGQPLVNESEYSCEFMTGVVPEMPMSSVCVSTNSDLSFLSDLLCMSNSYVKILRIFSYVLRFVSVKKSNVIVSGPLCASELDQAENRLIRMAQGEVFSS